MLDEIKKAIDSKKIENIFEIIYNRYCSKEVFTEDEASLINEGLKNFAKIPPQSLRGIAEKFAETDILSTNIKVFDNIKGYWNIIQGSMLL